MKKIKRVEIEWADSIANRAEVWQDIKDFLEDFEDEPFRTIGYLIRKDKDFVHVCQSLHETVDGEATRGAEYFTIPTGCIRKIKYL